jgi:hypothetical protein
MDLTPHAARARYGSTMEVPGREHLLEQIRVSQETIERSKELIQQIDKLLAKSPLQP